MSPEFIRILSSFRSRLKSKLLKDAMLNVQRTNSTKTNLTINSETHPKQNDENDTYRSARKTIGVVKVIRRRWGWGAKKNIYFSQK